MRKKVLFAGESWMTYVTHVKGFDAFYTSAYEEGVGYIRSAIEKAGYEMVYYPGHLVADNFPSTVEELNEYSAIFISDIGANSFLLPTKTFSNSIATPNRCDSIRDYVLQGGSFVMIGGYLTFSGIEAKARYSQTSIQEILPVLCLDIDDRAEFPQGITPVTLKAEHPILAGLPSDWPHLLGYNKTILRENAELIASVDGDPLIAAGEFGKGKSAVFTSDCAPHWAPPEFVNWSGYDLLWKNMLDYLTA